MAFDGTKFVRLSTVGNNDAPLLNGYRSSDSLATVLADGYFDDKALDLQGGDLILAHVAINPSGTLAASPFTTVNTSTTVTVQHALHGLYTGDKVTFASATAVGGVPAADLNKQHTITVVDADTYTIVVATAATSSTSGGGTPTFTSEGGGTKQLLQVDSKTVSAEGVHSNVQVKLLGGGEDTEAQGVWLTAELTDVSTASSAWLAAPFAGYIRRFKTILHGAISGSDAAVGIELGGTDVTGGQVTIANSGSAAGDVDETTATALNVVTEGQAVEIDTDGASTGTVSVTCMVEFVPFTA